MIIIGYQGIGKSTLANKDDKFIDLESGSFWLTNTDGSRYRYDNWYEMYCNVAEHLSQQGYIVFVSSYEVVRNRLKQSKERVFTLYPDVSLKDQWIQRLSDRYHESTLDKDYRALINAVDRYEENIKEIANSGFDSFVIRDINYDLKELIMSTIDINNY